jgi:hypothetical protein
MHFIAGAGTITTVDGTVHEVRPGVTWDIRETVRKVYAIWASPTDIPAQTTITTTGDPS